MVITDRVQAATVQLGVIYIPQELWGRSKGKRGCFDDVAGTVVHEIIHAIDNVFGYTSDLPNTTSQREGLVYAFFEMLDQYEQWARGTTSLSCKDVKSKMKQLNRLIAQGETGSGSVFYKDGPVMKTRPISSEDFRRLIEGFGFAPNCEELLKCFPDCN